MLASTKFFTITLFLAASLPAGILADSITCETTSGSPDTGSVTNVINELHGLGNRLCSNGNQLGSKCDTLVSHNEAAIAICGGPALQAVYCPDVASMANAIQQKCLSSDGRAGGKFLHEKGYTVEVIHS
ncbi:uncharacterized protein K452DRAFT_309030 [Aplosporella prunicola CBS 121167]|uniref:Uncharacterized protein n=1 Tax=Aplosporella prunicola CBS 121167 TaxID=1176127 RepID=A0A6A6BFH6_9PEZI|nr:uncharacterized protein K452DRAFT_309030 [Aplosporella prunicola CBS 121167]KAF2141241.1 hypothetical protein K452DRAFT_309030 [Aplosporella prunicola CBS 121167]